MFEFALPKMQIFVILATIAVAFHNAGALLSNIKRCPRSSDINECLKTAFQDALGKLAGGAPEVNFPAIEPIFVPAMTIGEGVTGAVHVVQNFKNVKIHGVTKGTFRHVEANILPNKLVINSTLNLPYLKFDAEYSFNGQILVLPIVGNGNCTVEFSNVQTTIVTYGKTFEKKGTTYVDIEKLDLSLKPTQIHFNFDNLFNGDARLGAEMNKILNDNSEAVFEDVRSGYEESLAIVFKSLCNIVHHKIPYENLFPLN